MALSPPVLAEPIHTGGSHSLTMPSLGFSSLRMSATDLNSGTFICIDQFKTTWIFKGCQYQSQNSLTGMNRRDSGVDGVMGVAVCTRNKGD